MLRECSLYICVSIYKLYSSYKYLKFLNGLINFDKSQKKLKEKINKRYLQSKIYKKYNCAFDKLPPLSYIEIEECIKGGLSEDEVLFYEKTSGSSAKVKHIPYTHKLKKSFQNLFIVWSHDILKNVSFSKYKFYFSISPQFDNSQQEKLNDDSEYLKGGILYPLIQRFFISVPNIKEVKDPYEFKMLLSLYLISNRDLEIISIWSPVFLTELIKFIQDEETIIQSHLSVGYYKKWKFESVNLVELSVENCFPNLKFISAWGSAYTSNDFKKLEKLFPNIRCQKKGLLATEGPLSLPLIEAKGFVPLVEEVFYEFIDEKGNIIELIDLQEKKQYEVLISQLGGLYRYRLNDIIKVTHFFKGIPCFDFVSRADATADLVGEKIHESDAKRALEDTVFRALLPSIEEKRYYVLVDSDLNFSKKDLENVELLLRENYHYHNARELGQLKSLKILSINNLEENIIRFFETKLNIKRGDQKQSYLYYRKFDLMLNYIKASSI